MTPHRDATDYLLVDAFIGEQCPGKLCFRQPRQDGIAANAEGRALLGKGFRHVDHGGLGDRVDRLAHARLQAVHRRGIDDGTTALFAHQLARLDRHEEIATNIHIDSLVVRGQVGIQHIAEIRIGGGIVDQDIETAMLLANGGKGCLDTVHVTDMAGQRLGTAAIGTNRIDDRLATFRLATADQYMRALLRQQPRNRLTNTTTGTGDQCNLAVEIKQVGFHALPSLIKAAPSAASTDVCLPVSSARSLEALPSSARLSTPWQMAASRKKLNTR